VRDRTECAAANAVFGKSVLGALVKAGRLAAVTLGGWLIAHAAFASDQSANSSDWALQGQVTNIWQYNPAFPSAFEGPQSFDHNNRAAETTDATLYAGVSPWSGAEVWGDPELNQGIALGNTLGVAGYINGDGSKEGKKHPYVRDLGDERRDVETTENQLATSVAADRFVITLGKFDVTDIFDTNTLAHDGRTDFFNWALIDTGSFDYASDAWGYTIGGSLEWYQGDWVARVGLFDLSTEPNGATLTPGLRQFQADGELEKHFKLAGKDGKLAVTVFFNRGEMGSFADALQLADATGHTPNTALVRKYSTRAGVSLNAEQSLIDSLSAFIRAGWDDGSKEPYEYADIDRTVAIGTQFKGDLWSRSQDEIGFAVLENWIGKDHELYLADGGLGILVGDGMLRKAAPEQIAEAYYSLGITKQVHLTLDVQLVNNPAYNHERGPIEVVGSRMHIEI